MPKTIYKTRYIDSMVISGSLNNDYIRLISSIKNNPIELEGFLNEINASINSKRREWLLEIFDTANDKTSKISDDQHNLGIVIIKCQLSGRAKWTNYIQQSEIKLVEAQCKEQANPQSSKTIKILGRTVYEKLSPSQKIQKQIATAIRQREVSQTIADNYFDILDDILDKNLTPHSYLSGNGTAKDFVLNLLMSKNGVSIFHLAAIHQDDSLLARALQIINKLITSGTNILDIYSLFKTRFKFTHDLNYKHFHGNTIGHCISSNAPALVNSVRELLLIFHNMLRHGLTTSQMRILLDMPIADIPEENINNMLKKYNPIFSEEVKLLYDGLFKLLADDYKARQQAVTRPVVVRSPVIIEPLIGSLVPDSRQLAAPAAVAQPLRCLPRLSVAPGRLQSLDTFMPQYTIYSHVQPEQRTPFDLDPAEHCEPSRAVSYSLI